MVSLPEVVRYGFREINKVPVQTLWNVNYQRRVVGHMLNQRNRSLGNKWSCVLGTNETEIQAALVFIQYVVDLRESRCTVAIEKMYGRWIEYRLPAIRKEKTAVRRFPRNTSQVEITQHHELIEWGRHFNY